MKRVHHNPRGPRSGPGYAVPVCHHLIDPIRPTRGHTAISPHGGLYAMPSRCGSAEATRARLRAFAGHSVLTCRPLRPREARHRYASSLAMTTRSSPQAKGSTLPILPQSDSRGRSISWLHWFTTATACQVARLPGRIWLGYIPNHRRLLRPASAGWAKRSVPTASLHAEEDVGTARRGAFAHPTC